LNFFLAAVFYANAIPEESKDSEHNHSSRKVLYIRSNNDDEYQILRLPASEYSDDEITLNTVDGIEVKSDTHQRFDEEIEVKFFL
jgi:hypothetical protein